MDPGLLAYLLGIERAAQLERDPLVGQVFENLVVLEILKARYNAGLPGGLSYFRDSHSHELDLLLKVQGELRGIEIKSSQTYHSSFAKTLDWFQESIAPLKERYVIYSGPELRFSNGTTALHFYDASQVTQD